MANIKKLNGYDITDSKFKKLTATIESLSLDEAGVSGSNDIDIILPTGWTSGNTFIIGGYLEIKNNNQVVTTLRINSNLTDSSTGNVTFINEINYYAASSTNINAKIENYISEWVGYDAKFTILAYYKN